MRINLLTASLVIAVLIGLSAAALNQVNHKSNILAKRATLVCRAIGDQLLRHAGDTRSRVLPVKQLGNGVFQLEFQSSFTFVPDTLVKIVQSNIASNGLPENYTVNVYHCPSGDIVYGFQIDSQHNDIVPCLGRDQPSGCYTVQIAFADLEAPLIGESKAFNYLAFVLGMSFLVMIGKFYFRKTKKETNSIGNKTISIGNCLFNFDRQSLSNGFGTIELSEIEAKLLTILAKEQNKLVTRERLLKEVWEDNGVFTSRSLDMFISKLRKKFKQDDSVELINIYGKGYKLEVK